ncbi:MAG: hypothetical protein WC911_01515 [Thermoleophilia bacterium]
MQVSSKLLFRTAIIMLGMLLMLGLYMSMSSSVKTAKGMDSTQWEKVRGYVDKYLNDQYNAADDGEAGYLEGKITIQDRLDNGGVLGLSAVHNATYLGEGDDAANAPVLVDNLMQLTNIIPGTSFRCRWNAGTDGGNCLSTSSAATVKGLVDAHAAAGFSTDIIVYCGTGHTEAPTAGAFGFFAQVPGALATSGTPKVYAMKWGRAGWTNSLATSTAANASAGPETSAGGFAAPTNANCGSSPDDVELVRCMANWALQSTSVGGGNVGNGAVTATVSGAGQTVDVRTGTLTNGVSSAGANIQVPVTSVFDLGQANISPTATTIIASRTPMVGGIVAEGAKMLGYNMANGAGTANSFISGGLPAWNAGIAGIQVSEGSTLATQTITAYTSPAKVDTVNPSITSSSATPTSSTTADITRVTSEPATSKIALTGPGAPAVNVNNTILNGTKTTSLTGLVPGVTYTGTLTVYDAQANSSSTAISFTTTCVAGKPSLSLSAPAPFWGSYADYLAGILSVNWTISNTGGTVAYDVTLTNTSNTNGVTMVVPSASLGTIAGGGSATATLKYGGFVTGGYTTIGSWRTVNTGTAKDECGTLYTYP